MANKMNEKINSLKSKAEACLSQKVDVPMSPLWELGMAGQFGKQKNFDRMQEAINYLTCKAKAKLNFTEDEKEFLIELYEAFWWGGKYKGMHEAAMNANHYVNGKGKRLKLDSKVYESSVIVQDTMMAIKDYIREQIKLSRSIGLISSRDPKFHSSKYSKALQSGRNINNQGKILGTGALLTEQKNERLKKADHRFYLQSSSIKVGEDRIKTRWFVETLYDFESFEDEPYHITDLDLTSKLVLLLPDGLSHYMTVIGIAKSFWHYAEWHEVWEL